MPTRIPVTGGAGGTGQRTGWPRRVLMTADAFGGVWSYALELAAALAPHGTEVVLATMGAPLDRDQRADSARRGIRWHESSHRLEWMPDAWAEVDRAAAWLLELEAEEMPDLVHLNGFCHADLGWHAPVVVVGHWCVWSWWRAVHGGDPPPEWHPYRRRAAAGLRAADRVVAPTRAMLSALEDAYGSLPHGSVVWNGRRAAHGSASRKEELVFSAGRLWDEDRNLAALDRAAARLCWPVVVAADTRVPGEPDHDLPAPRHMGVLGYLSAGDRAQWMARAAIYAAPARYEPFGFGPLDAAQAGCALVLGDIPSLREMWEDAAWFVPPGDANALAAALERVIADQTLRIRLAAAARRRARSFDPERMARQYLDVYQAASWASAPLTAGGDWS